MGRIRPVARHTATTERGRGLAGGIFRICTRGIDLAAAQHSQVKATTHPFHYDSICLNGLGCDVSVPRGARSLADFFAIDYSTISKRLSVVFNRGEKQPDEAAGHVATLLVVTQTAGPSNGGGSVSSSQATLRQSSADPTGDALSSYSMLAPLAVPPAPATMNEAAADFVSASIGSEVDPSPTHSSRTAGSH